MDFCLAITLKVECNTILFKMDLISKFLVKKSFFCKINEFTETKIILNLIIFAHWSENYQMTNMHTVLLRAFQWYQKWNEELYSLEELLHGHSSKETNK
jgi:hypothetical protein